ncbi:hypothetical protein ACFSUJ_18350 [Streptomyces lusitanus]|uniref:Secreted protein n=1 Tax=Streptomyces lusitanus TaxID=68232 RepID=A0ABU3JXD1_9ACTN|nr:hypothetical protein [Streptomyces lusitanus]
MTRNTLRLAAVSAVAAVTVGAGASLAQASQATASARPAASSQVTLSAADARAVLANPTVSAQLTAGDTASLRAVANGTATDVQARGAVGAAAKALYKLLKKHGGKVYNGAVKAAKSNWGKFRSYMDGLPWYHPVRIAWVAAGAEAQYQLYSYIRSLL